MFQVDQLRLDIHAHQTRPVTTYTRFRQGFYSESICICHQTLITIHFRPVVKEKTGADKDKQQQ